MINIEISGNESESDIELDKERPVAVRLTENEKKQYRKQKEKFLLNISNEMNDLIQPALKRIEDIEKCINLALDFEKELSLYEDPRSRKLIEQAEDILDKKADLFRKFGTFDDTFKLVTKINDQIDYADHAITLEKGRMDNIKSQLRVYAIGSKHHEVEPHPKKRDIDITIDKVLSKRQRLIEIQEPI